MDYIENNLMTGEKIIYRTTLHWVIFIAPIILTLTVFLTFIGIPWLILAFIAYKTSEFGVTDKRVIIKTGFISRNTIETLLKKVEAINVNQDILGRIFNSGTITIMGTGGTKNVFKNIADPLEFRKKVQEQIEHNG